MKIACYGGNGYESNCYIITDEDESEALVLDPSVSLREVERERQKSLPPISAIILSHAHFDHMLQLDAWRSETGAPLLTHTAEAGAVPDGEKNLYRLFTGQNGGSAMPERLLCEGDILPVGDESLTVLHTPGHTPGCICLYTAGHLLSGDTLFAGTVGRTDFPGGTESELRASLRALSKLPGATAVYPGHGPATTIEREKKINPYMIGD